MITINYTKIVDLWLDKWVTCLYNVIVMKKPLSKFQLAKQDRDLKIKLYYQSLPPGMRSMRRIAKLFKVGKSTVLYAVNGRNHNK